MNKKIFAIFLILIIVGISGCTINPKSNETFGEKKLVTADKLYIINSSGELYDINGTSYYIVRGYIGNKGEERSLKAIITAKAFDKDDNLVATNTSAHFQLENIPAKGESLFSLRFKDPNKVITRYELGIST